MKIALLVSSLLFAGISSAGTTHDSNRRPSSWNKHSMAASHGSNGHKASEKPGWFKRSGKGGSGRTR